MDSSLSFDSIDIEGIEDIFKDLAIDPSFSGLLNTPGRNSNRSYGTNETEKDITRIISTMLEGKISTRVNVCVSL